MTEQKFRIRLPEEEVKKRRSLATMRNIKRNIESWIGFIPLETKCECCNKTVHFLCVDKNFAIHFDHRNGRNSIRPSSWLRSHKCNEKHKKIWESYDFGMLCKDCNGRLPTDNRTEFLKNAIRYQFGDKTIYAYKGTESSITER